MAASSMKIMNTTTRGAVLSKPTAAPRSLLPTRFSDKTLLAGNRPYDRCLWTAAAAVCAPTSKDVHIVDKVSSSPVAIEGDNGVVEFKIHYATVFGEIVKLAGNSSEFGSWKVDQALTLTWSKGDIWTARVALQPTQEYEFKCVVYNTKTKQARWEDGKNRRLDVSSSPSVVDIEWGSNAAAPASAHVELTLSPEELAARAAERKEGASLIAQAFASMTAAAAPGTSWAASSHFTYGTPEQEFAEAVQALGLKQQEEVAVTAKA